MKNFIGLLIAVLFASASFGQIATDDSSKQDNSKNVNVNISVSDDDIEISYKGDSLQNNNPDTTRFRIGKKKFMVIEDDDDFSFEDDDESPFDEDDKDVFKGHFDGFEMGLNMFMTSDFETTLPPDAEFLELNTNKSWEVAINFAQKSFPIVERRIGIVTGMGIQFNNYKFERSISLGTDDDGITYQTIDTVDFIKNKLTTTYLTVPLMLEFQVPTGHNDRPLYLAAGVTGSLKLGSHTKQVYERNNKKYKDKVREDFNLSPLRYGVTARMGYGGVGLFANYSMTSLFEKGKGTGTELYPFTVGISFTGW